MSSIPINLDVTGSDVILLHDMSDEQKYIIKKVPTDKKLSMEQLKTLLGVNKDDGNFKSDVVISPIIAKRILSANNDFNRRINMNHVNVLARQMSNGDWNYNGSDTISFNKNAVITNGQHRLAAVAKSGVTIHCDIKLNSEQFAGNDTAMVRSFEDNTIFDSNLDKSLQTLAGIRDDSIIDEDATNRFRDALHYFRVALKIYKGGSINTAVSSAQNLSQPDFLRLVNKHKDIIIKFVNADLLQKPTDVIGKKAMLSYFYASYYMALNAGVSPRTLKNVDNVIKFIVQDAKYTGIRTFGTEVSNQKSKTGRLTNDEYVGFIRRFQYMIKLVELGKNVKSTYKNKIDIAGGYDDSRDVMVRPDFTYTDVDFMK